MLVWFLGKLWYVLFISRRIITIFVEYSISFMCFRNTESFHGSMFSVWDTILSWKEHEKCICKCPKSSNSSEKFCKHSETDLGFTWIIIYPAHNIQDLKWYSNISPWTFAPMKFPPRQLPLNNYSPPRELPPMKLPQGQLPPKTISPE